LDSSLYLAELRNIIYDLVVNSETTIVFKDNVVAAPALSTACHQLRKEYLLVLRHHNPDIDRIEAHITDFDFPALYLFLNRLPPRGSRRGVAITLHFANPEPAAATLASLRRWVWACTHGYLLNGYQRTYKVDFDWTRYTLVQARTMADALPMFLLGTDASGRLQINALPYVHGEYCDVLKWVLGAIDERYMQRESWREVWRAARLLERAEEEVLGAKWELERLREEWSGHRRRRKRVVVLKVRIGVWSRVAGSLGGMVHAG